MKNIIIGMVAALESVAEGTEAEHVRCSSCHGKIPAHFVRTPETMKLHGIFELFYNNMRVYLCTDNCFRSHVRFIFTRNAEANPSPIPAPAYTEADYLQP